MPASTVMATRGVAYGSLPAVLVEPHAVGSFGAGHVTSRDVNVDLIAHVSGVRRLGMARPRPQASHHCTVRVHRAVPCRARCGPVDDGEGSCSSEGACGEGHSNASR